MNWAAALKPLAGILALFAAAMLVLGVLVANDVEFAIVPTPETEAEQQVLKVKREHRIRDARGESAQKEGDRAIAAVRVKLEDKTEETVELPLEKEHGLWRVSSLEPLGRLTR